MLLTSILFFLFSFALVVITITIVKYIIFNQILKQFTEIDEYQKREEFLIKASKNINTYFKYELYSSVILLFLGILDNNLIEFIFALLFLLYNIYSRIKGIYQFSLIIDDKKNNLKDANKVGFLYKVKFLLYTIITCISSVNCMLQFFHAPKFFNRFKIIY